MDEVYESRSSSDAVLLYLGGEGEGAVEVLGMGSAG